MATVIVTILPCQHVILTVTHAGKTFDIVKTRSELVEELTDEQTARESLFIQMRAFIRERRAAGDTWAQVKTALEAEVFRV